MKAILFDQIDNIIIQLLKKHYLIIENEKSRNADQRYQGTFCHIC